MYKVEDVDMQRPAGVLFDMMWEPHGIGIVRERASQDVEKVTTTIFPPAFVLSYFCCLLVFFLSFRRQQSRTLTRGPTFRVSMMPTQMLLEAIRVVELTREGY